MFLLLSCVLFNSCASFFNISSLKTKSINVHIIITAYLSSAPYRFCFVINRYLPHLNLLLQNLFSNCVPLVIVFSMFHFHRFFCYASAYITVIFCISLTSFLSFSFSVYLLNICVQYLSLKELPLFLYEFFFCNFILSFSNFCFRILIT